MTGRDARLLRYREKAAGALNRYQGVIFRYQGVWQLKQAGRVFEYPCAFQVKDTQKQGREGIALAEAAVARYQDAVFKDIRLLKVHPDQERPPEGSVLREYRFLGQTLDHFDGGQLTVLEWSQPSDFTDLAVGTCLIRR